MKQICTILLTVLLLITPALATDYYVDKAVSSSGNGSKSSPWKDVANMTGVVAGDNIYFSGGSAGSSKTYDTSGASSGLTRFGGTAGNRVTYAIWNESGHNGLAIFTGGWDAFITKGHVVISGDTGDGGQHIELSGGRPVYVLSEDEIRITHVDFGTRNYDMYFGSSGTSCKDIDILHTVGRWERTAAGHADVVLTFAVGGGTWGNNEVAYNTWEIPNKEGSCGTGNDGIVGNMYSVDIHHNTFISYPDANYYNSPDQHTDGIQTRGGERLRIYNNVFEGFNNYGIYLHMDLTNHKYIRVFNNLIPFPDENCATAGSQAGIVATVRNGDLDFTDTIIFNNTVVDTGPGKVCIFFNDDSVGGGTTFTDCGFYNNLCANVGYNNVDSQVDSSNNIQISAAEAANVFQSYTSYNYDNNYNIKPSATNVLGQGCKTNCGSSNEDLTVFTTVDLNDATRPANWSLGAYDSSEGATSPTVTFTLPNSAPTYATSVDAVSFAGTSTSDSAIQEVTYSCPTCTPSSGIAQGASSWSFGAIMASGENVVTVTARDADNDTGSSVKTVTYTPPPVEEIVGLSGGSSTIDLSGGSNTMTLSP